jgi:hypothetical protein
MNSHAIKTWPAHVQGTEVFLRPRAEVMLLSERVTSAGSCVFCVNTELCRNLGFACP